jgi:hypothetical protein
MQTLATAWNKRPSFESVKDTARESNVLIRFYLALLGTDTLASSGDGSKPV